ncbi:MAG: hypothetical protein RBU23_01075 [Candidatus Auribacterota bacterium]|jgi:hypothetical protein|nr:hypothetical protein [Candidatus Auribacterota bacterium]
MKTRMLFAIALVGILAGEVMYGDATERFLLDDFESFSNALFSKTATYKKDPSDAKKGTTKEHAYSGEQSLYIGFKKEATGFCGYYTELISMGKYFDASAYSKLTFMVKGKRGEENFQVGLADKYWYEAEDSVKSADIGNYLPEGKVTQEWQKAEIPLNVYTGLRPDFDLTKLGSMAICFETACFPDGTGKGVIYIDDIAFE